MSFAKHKWFFFFEGFPGLSRVQIPAGNAHFPAAFSSHATYARGSLWGSWIPPGGWGVAESGGNRFKLRNRLKLFSKKSFKRALFKIPSWKLKNIFLVVYPHQTLAPYTPCTPPNPKGRFWTGCLVNWINNYVLKLLAFMALFHLSAGLKYIS